MVRGVSTAALPTWVFPPYGALAGELILGNKAVTECGGLAQESSFRGIAKR
jgi:hypothetical protein